MKGLSPQRRLPPARRSITFGCDAAGDRTDTATCVLDRIPLTVRRHFIFILLLTNPTEISENRPRRRASRVYQKPDETMRGSIIHAGRRSFTLNQSFIFQDLNSLPLSSWTSVWLRVEKQLTQSEFSSFDENSGFDAHHITEITLEGKSSTFCTKCLLIFITERWMRKSILL